MLSKADFFYPLQIVEQPMKFKVWLLPRMDLLIIQNFYKATII